MIILTYFFLLFNVGHSILLDSTWTNKQYDTNKIYYTNNQGEHIYIRKLSNSSRQVAIQNLNPHLDAIQISRNVGLTLFGSSSLEIIDANNISWKGKNKKFDIVQYKGVYRSLTKNTLSFLEWNVYAGKELYQFIYFTKDKDPILSNVQKIFFTHKVFSAKHQSRDIASNEEGAVCLDCESANIGHTAKTVDRIPPSKVEGNVCESIDPKKRANVNASVFEYKENANTIGSKLKNEGINTLACLEGIGDTLIGTFDFFWEGLVEGKWGSALGTELADYVEKNKKTLSDTSFGEAALMSLKNGISSSAKWAANKWSARIDKNKKTILKATGNDSEESVTGWRAKTTNFIASQVALGMAFTQVDYIIDAPKAAVEAKEGLQLVWDLAANYVTKEVAEFSCLTPAEQAHYLCSFIGIIIETAGTWELAVVKLVKAGKSAAELSTLASDAMLAFKGSKSADALLDINRQSLTGKVPVSSKSALEADELAMAIRQTASTASVEARQQSSRLLSESMDLRTKTKDNKIDFQSLARVVSTKDPKVIRQYADVLSALNKILKNGFYEMADGSSFAVKSADELLQVLKQNGLLNPKIAKEVTACLLGSK